MPNSGSLPDRSERDSLRNMIAHHDSWAATYDADIAGMVLYNRITWDNIRRFLPEDRDDPAYLPWAGHLEIAGRRR